MGAQPLVGLYGVLEKTEQGWEDAEATLAEVRRQLEAAGLTVATAPAMVADDASAGRAVRFFQEADPDLLLAVVITWSFDHLSVRILKALERPLAILAIPGIIAGSLVGAHQLGCLLTDLGIERMEFYGDVRQPRTYEPLLAYARAAAVRRRLSTGKLAVVGRRTPGMTAIAFDEVELMSRFGCQTLSFGWEEIHERVKALAPGRVDAEVKRMHGLAGTVSSTDSSLRDSLALYLAMKDLAAAEGILVYALGCYPHMAGTVCLLAALLSDEGVPAACEGDMNAGLAMYLIQELTGEPAHFGEILDIDERANTLLTSHCGAAAPSLASDRAGIALVPVRIWERGVCIRFPAKPAAKATFVNIAGRAGTYRLCAASGAAVSSGMVFEGNPVKFRPDCTWQALLSTIEEHGFGHHWMMGYRDVTEELRRFCRFTGVKGVFPGAADRSSARVEYNGRRDR
jgi:L-fucose isomerase-like protein